MTLKYRKKGLTRISQITKNEELHALTKDDIEVITYTYHFIN